MDALPAPLPFSARNALRTIAPGEIGMGEWITGALFGFTVFACFGAFIGDARLLSILGATAASLTVFSALQILRMNTTLLPRELRPQLWRKIALVATALSYSAISIAMFHQLFSR